MAKLFMLIPGRFIRSDCRLLNSVYLWAARRAYGKVDALFRAMGYGTAQWADVMDRELIFPRIRAGFEETG